MNSLNNSYIVKGTGNINYMMSDSIYDICRLMEFMKKVIYKNELFHTEYTKDSGQRRKTISSLGKHLEFLHKYSQIYSRDYTFSPLIKFYFEEYRKHRIKDYFLVLDEHDPYSFSADIFNDFVSTMRKNAMAIKLKKRVDDWESKSKNNMKRLITFEKALFNRYARLMVIRLDFNYHKATFTASEIERMIDDAASQKEHDQADYFDGQDISTPRVVEGRIALEEVQKDRKRLFTNVKGKPSLFKHLVGYVWRIEFGRQAGYHLHVLFFFDGAYVQKHEYLAQEIGDYWRNVITQGRGYFENCNRKKSKYGEAWALGEIDHWDAIKRHKLSYAMQYFCKTNQLVQVVPYKGCHLFHCGFVRRQRKVYGGRPRTKLAIGPENQQLGL